MYLKPIPGRTDTTVFLFNLWKTDFATEYFLQDVAEKLWDQTLTPVEASKKVFGRESDDNLLLCLFYLLSMQKKEVRELIKNVMYNENYEDVEDAKEHIGELKNKYCSDIKGHVFDRRKIVRIAA